MSKLFVFLIIFFSFFPAIDLEAKPLDVVINEIAWMGTKQSYNDEWIELYNNRNFDLNLEKWKIISEDKRLIIFLKGVISKNGFFILERSDDTTIPHIKADLIYKGSLNNKGEHLMLVDAQGQVVDEVDCLSGWFAGNNITKQTMERKNPLKEGNNPQNWQSSENIQGTPRRKNSLLGTISKTQNKNQVLSRYPLNIFISEIMPSPEGPDSQNEWIEIFNQNNFEVDLSGWKINDGKGKTTTYIFPKNTIIEKEGFLLFPRTVTKITLNNDGDIVFLSHPDGEIIDQVSYINAPRGQSFARIENKWFWTSDPTPEAVNKPLSLVQEKKETKEYYLAAKISPTDLVKKESSKLSPYISPHSSPFLSILGIALTFALSCGIISLHLKKGLKTAKDEIHF